MKYSLLFFFFCPLFFSCDHETLTYDKPYFDFDSLVNAQIKRLSKTKVVIGRRSQLNQRKDSISFTPDTLQWQHELNAFAQLDVINKPMFKNKYQLSESEDDHSNLQVLTYTSTIKSTVPWLKFYYQGNLKKIKKIESLYEESNLMFASQRRLLLEFESKDDQLIMTHYQVNGFQKMILSDTTLFLLDGVVRYQ